MPRSGELVHLSPPDPLNLTGIVLACPDPPIAQHGVSP